MVPEVMSKIMEVGVSKFIATNFRIKSVDIFLFMRYRVQTSFERVQSASTMIRYP